MAQKRSKANAMNGGAGRVFPPEAYTYQDEVTPEQIERLREKVGVDFGGDDWETIDGFGQVVRT